MFVLLSRGAELKSHCRPFSSTHMFCLPVQKELDKHIFSIVLNYFKLNIWVGARMPIIVMLTLILIPTIATLSFPNYKNVIAVNLKSN